MIDFKLYLALWLQSTLAKFFEYLLHLFAYFLDRYRDMYVHHLLKSHIGILSAKVLLPQQ